MEMGTAVSAVDSLDATLKKLENKEFLSMCGCKSQIGELLVTVPKLRALFLQAERLSEVHRSRIRELKDAIFEANRVLEDIDVQLLKDRGGLFKKMRLYWVAYCVSHELRKIRNNFGARDLFISTPDIAPQPERNYIIGRGDGAEDIVGMLLDSSNLQCDPSFLSIVGVRGLGKTAFAQLVFNHPSVTTAFPLRLWTCIGDTFDIDKILIKILQSATYNNLRQSEEQQEEGVECNINLMPRLSTLTLHGLPQLVSLPNWMQFLPALQSLEISFCNQLRSMPNWMPNLQSLTHLTVSGCSKSLKKRCQQQYPPVKDRRYIRHIWNVDFSRMFLLGYLLLSLNSLILSTTPVHLP